MNPKLFTGNLEINFIANYLAVAFGNESREATTFHKLKIAVVDGLIMAAEVVPGEPVNVAVSFDVKGW